MQSVLVLLTLQGLVGAFDNYWNHERGAGLARRPTARRELQLHAVRGMLYGPLFLSFAWIAWQGWLAWTFGALLMIELGITLLDFAEEDRTRVLPANERVVHTLMCVNFGAILALFAPQLIEWGERTTGFAAESHGLLSWILTVYAIGACGWGVRDAVAAMRLARPALATWQRRQLAVRRTGLPRSILMAGATGFIGRHLTWFLIERGHRVVVLARRPEVANDLFGPHAEVIPTLDHLPRGRRIDAVVNLAGESIAGARWTSARKALLVESRVGTTRMLVQWMQRQSHRPGVLVNASAVGWYGTSADTPQTESALAGGDVGAVLCSAWEREAQRAETFGTRVVRLRFGLVLGPGGMLARLWPVFRAGLGTSFGSGRQSMPWVHLEDALAVVTMALDDHRVTGPVNVVAPELHCNRSFCRALAQTAHRPLGPGIPAWPLRLTMGEMSTLLLDGVPVVPAYLEALGYRFRHPTLPGALAALTTRSAATPLRRAVRHA